MHLKSVFIRGGRGAGVPDPPPIQDYWGVGPLPQIWTKICQLYKCAINVNTGLNIVLEFNLEGLIF